MEFLVTLYRDSLQTAWGFRLEGGRDFKAPLSIQRVFTGTPASSDILRGDIITSIFNEDANTLFHQEANELIRAAGGSLQLGVRRLPSNEKLQFQPFQSYKTNTIDFSNLNNKLTAQYMNNEDDASTHYRSHGIEKYKNPKPILSQTGSLHLPTYQPFTVGECSSVQRYTAFKPLPKTDLLTYNRACHPKFAQTNGSAQPYVDRRMIGNIQQNLTRAVHAPHVTYPMQSRNGSVPSLPKTTMKVGKYEVKSFSGHQQQSHEMSFQSPPSQFNSSYANYASPNQSSSSTSSLDQNKVRNKQYNSPIGLYSNNAIKEEYTKQVQYQHMQTEL